jgi:hypothetical protein
LLAALRPDPPSAPTLPATVVPVDGGPAPLDAQPAEREPELSPPPLALCAAILARAQLHPEQRAQALAEAELTAEQWEAGCAHWEDRIATALGRGERDALARFDSAYVGELERLRGPIFPEDHARIDRAAENGSVEAALQELRLPLEGRMRIQRTWIKRWCREPTARARYLAALRELQASRSVVEE